MMTMMNTIPATDPPTISETEVSGAGIHLEIRMLNISNKYNKYKE